MDATYWGHNWGVMLGLDAQIGRVLYMAFIRSETNADYVAAVTSIKDRGYEIRGPIVDGKKSLFETTAKRRSASVDISVLPDNSEVSVAWPRFS